MPTLAELKAAMTAGDRCGSCRDSIITMDEVLLCDLHRQAPLLLIDAAEALDEARWMIEWYARQSLRGGIIHERTRAVRGRVLETLTAIHAALGVSDG